MLESFYLVYSQASVLLAPSIEGLSTDSYPSACLGYGLSPSKRYLGLSKLAYDLLPGVLLPWDSDPFLRSQLSLMSWTSFWGAGQPVRLQCGIGD